MKKSIFVCFVVLCLAALCAFAFRPQIAWGFVLAGNQFFGGRLPYNLNVADGLYRAALSIDNEVPDAWHQRARVAFLKGDFNTALERINTQLALHGDSFMASYYIRGLVYGYMHAYAPAEKDFLHFLEWSPHSWAANNDLAWVYFAQGKFQQAKERATVGLEGDPYNPWLLMTRGMSLYNLGDARGAQKDLELARDAAAGLPDSAWTHAYPGNDPSIAPQGLDAFRRTIDADLELVHKTGTSH